MSDAQNAPILVTGCSSGIGRAIAIRLAEAGTPVFASARRLESIDDLAATGCQLLELDVTDPESRRSAVERIEAEYGAVGSLVNNAGYGQTGPFEETPLEAFRAQFETNVFAVVALCQLVLPGMRRAGRGRIVNLSSMGGDPINACNLYRQRYGQDHPAILLGWGGDGTPGGNWGLWGFWMDFPGNRTLLDPIDMRFGSGFGWFRTPNVIVTLPFCPAGGV